MLKKVLVGGLSVLLAGLVIYGCGKVVDSGGGGGGGSTTLGALTGSVSKTNGDELDGVTATVAGTSAATNASGWFAIGNLDVTSGTTIVLSKTGYVSYQTSVEVAGGETRHHDYILALQNDGQTFSAATGDTLSDNSPGGTVTSTVTVPANALVDSTGAAYTGTATLALTPGDATSTNEIEALFPGDFTAIATSGTTVYITSYGFANFNVTDSSGGALNLASGQTAEWKMEIPAAQAAGAPATIDMWYFDEDDNTWKQAVDGSGDPIVGTKVQEGSKWYYIGSITHFSTWNYDVAYPRAYISGRVVNTATPEAQPVQGAEVNCWGNGWRYARWRSGETGTNSLGRFVEIPVETGVVFQCQATKGSQQSQLYSFGPFAANTVNDVGDLVIAGGSTANIQFILTWGQYPTDLDSHLTIPSTTSHPTRGHVYYASQGSPSSYPYAWLDVDDVTSYGPEVTTVTSKLTGTYRFCIHNFSGQSSHKMESSGARIEAMIDSQYYVWNIPTSNPSDYNVWQVCDVVIDSSGNVSVTSLNTFASTTGGDPYDPPGASGLPTPAQVQEIINKQK